MYSQDQRNTGNKEESSPRITFENNLAQLSSSEPSTLDRGTQDRSSSDVGNYQMNEENKDSELITTEEINDIFRNLINNGHHGHPLEDNVGIFINPHDLISPAVIPYCSRIYQFFRGILDCAAVKIKVPEHHQQKFVVIRIISSFLPSKIV